MALAAFQDQPKTPEEFATWSFAHAAHHLDIIRGIEATLPNTFLNMYIIDPLNPLDQEQLKNWLFKHQQLHFDMNNTFGIASSNLIELNYTDPGAFNTWMTQNFTEHQLLSQILGID